MKTINADKAAAIETAVHSSKGNQPKWFIGNRYYKADYMGYEGLSEYVISRLLEKSNTESFVEYAPIGIIYDGKSYVGCESVNFLHEGEELITFERLHRAYKGTNLYKTVCGIPDVRDRIIYTVDFIGSMTGLEGVGEYLTLIAELDMIFLNEDRHFNNLSMIRNEKGEYRLAPIFDNGLSLLADMKTDYPLGTDIYNAISKVSAKPFCRDFNEQTDTFEELYGVQLSFNADKADIGNILAELNKYYSDEILSRVGDIILEQMRKYGIYFNTNL